MSWWTHWQNNSFWASTLTRDLCFLKVLKICYTCLTKLESANIGYCKMCPCFNRSNKYATIWTILVDENMCWRTGMIHESTPSIVFFSFEWHLSTSSCGSSHVIKYDANTKKMLYDISWFVNSWLVLALSPYWPWCYSFSTSHYCRTYYCTLSPANIPKSPKTLSTALAKVFIATHNNGVHDLTPVIY